VWIAELEIQCSRSKVPAQCGLANDVRRTTNDGFLDKKIGVSNSG
jgi:hypothetical protein